MKTKVAALVVVLILLGIANIRAVPPMPVHSEVRLRGANEYGTTGLYARVFTVVNVNTGSDITYNSDTTNGDSFTINSIGVYEISYTDTSPFEDILGITINQSATSFLQQVAQDSVVCKSNLIGATGNNTIFTSCSGTLTLNSGDVIRAHRNIGGVSGGVSGCNCDVNPYAVFIISEVKGL